jgi:hypothetical protein
MKCDIMAMIIETTGPSIQAQVISSFSLMATLFVE